MKVVLLGCPGAGKGTYASRYLTKIYNVPHISTGELFRENIKNSTELGKKAKEYIDAGKLVPDEITISMLNKRLEQDDAQEGFFLDGFPRTVEQAKALEEITEIDKVLNFIADEEVIIRRISGRRTCRNCGAIYHLTNIIPKQEGVCDKCGGEIYQRADEKPEVVKERLREYHEKTAPVIEYYDSEGLLVNIDANLDVNHPDFHVIEDCKKVLDKIKGE